MEQVPQPSEHPCEKEGHIIKIECALVVYLNRKSTLKNVQII